VTLLTAATSAAFSISASSAVVHTFCQYTLSVTWAGTHSSGDYVTFGIPSSMAFSASPTCSPISGITSISCLASNSTTLTITLTSIPSTTTQISIANIRNYDITNSPVTFKISVFNSNNYLMENSPTKTLSFTTPAQITTFAVSNNDLIALYESSTISITLSSPFSIDSSFSASQTSLVLNLPS